MSEGLEAMPDCNSRGLERREVTSRAGGSLQIMKDIINVDRAIDRDIIVTRLSSGR